MQPRPTWPLVLLLFVSAQIMTVPALSAAPPPAVSKVSFAVVREHGPGTAAQAQPHVDKLMARIGDLTRWQVEGRYHRDRNAARTYLSASRAGFALLPLPVFLDFREELGLRVIGSVDVSAAGGRRYHLVSTAVSSLDGCRGKSLASDHLDDVRFIDRVVADGAYKIDQFAAVPMRRPMQPVKAALRGESACALIDDAQLAAAKRLEGAATLRTVWSSAELPPMALVAVRDVPAAQRRVLAQQLSHVCRDSGIAVCEAAGIRALKTASSNAYALVVAAYGDG